MIAGWRERLPESGVVRLLVGIALSVRGSLFMLLGRRFRAIDDFCRVVRVSRVYLLESMARSVVFRIIRALQASDDNAMIRAYHKDPASGALASIFSIAGSGKADLFRDVIVLKPCTREEKGVILLKYARTFSAVVALFDLPRLMQRYTFVLEPCWAGYCDPAILFFIARGNPVVVQCFTEEDYNYIASIGAPLIPMRLGPADWVNARIFQAPRGEKKYDIVMVANWAKHKRHSQLFRALSGIRDRDVSVLLCGFAWADRTADDIRREAAAMNNPRVKVEIREQVPQTELAGLVGQSKAFVFLSRKEGDNKALVEAMFADVPAIVYDETIGGARSRINPSTGVLSSDAELPQKILHMLDHHADFHPREWALAHTGSVVATQALDDTLRHAVTQAGGKYTTGIVEKTNAPNLAYKNPEVRAGFAADYEYILACQRPSSRS
jgi:glycosyltransferase involved in cell wall biosynthesis